MWPSRRRREIFKIATLIWMLVATELAGVAMTVIVTVPQFLDQGMRFILIFCGAAVVVAMPIYYLIARRLAPEPAA